MIKVPYVCTHLLHRVQLFATPWTVARQLPCLWNCPGKSGLPFPTPGDHSNPRDRSCISCVSCIARWILYHCTTWEAHYKKPRYRNFPVLQWLSLCASDAGGMGSIPGWRTKIARATRQKKKEAKIYIDAILSPKHKSFISSGTCAQ